MGETMSRERALRMKMLLTAVLAVLSAGGITGMVLDRPRRWLSFHVAFDVLMIALALAVVIGLWIGWRRAENAAAKLFLSVEAGRAERDACRESARNAREGLARSIDRQFSAWALTPAEREVAILVLKGHSHKGIAKETVRSEHTVRQHAAAAYQKAGVTGRAELAAFFLEDLILPRGERVVRRFSKRAGPAQEYAQEESGPNFMRA
jgi:DNA-binding CsgD family transcriptional regulator